MKKILIPNGSRSELALIYAAKSKGFYVITSGNDPSLVGHKYADEYIYADFSDKDALLKVFQESGADYICSACHDLAYMSTTYVAEKMGLPGHDSYETALTLHHKDRFKKMAAELNLSVPKGKGFDNKEDALAYCREIGDSYAVMVKPVDLGGGKGISKAFGYEEMAQAVEVAFNASKAKRIVVEQFVDQDGYLHSMSCYLINKKVVFTFCDNGHCMEDINPYYVFTSSSPGFIDEEVQAKLVPQVEQIAEKLNLVDGKIHFNFLVDKANNPYILEMHRRSSGDMYAWFVQMSTGIDWPNWILSAEIGEDVSKFPREGGKQMGYFFYAALLAEREGTVETVTFSDELVSHIRRYLPMYGKGNKITNHKIQPVGVLHGQCNSREELENLIRNIRSHYTVAFE